MRYKDLNLFVLNNMPLKTEFMLSKLIKYVRLLLFVNYKRDVKSLVLFFCISEIKLLQIHNATLSKKSDLKIESPKYEVRKEKETFLFQITFCLFLFGKCKLCTIKAVDLLQNSINIPNIFTITKINDRLSSLLTRLVLFFNELIVNYNDLR